jgi:Zn-finger domain-containing protein
MVTGKLTVVDIEIFIKRIEKLLEKEEAHLDFLYDKRIELLNKKIKTLDSDIDKMIETSTFYLEHYRKRLTEYIEYKDKMIKNEFN